MFDTIEIDGRSVQTKALGKSLSVYRHGDAVAVRRAPVSQADQASADAGEWPGDPGLGADCQLLSSDGWVVVRSGRIDRWAAQPVPGIPMADYHGWPLAVIDEPAHATPDQRQRISELRGSVYADGRAAGLTQVPALKAADAALEEAFLTGVLAPVARMSCGCLEPGPHGAWLTCRYGLR